MRKPQHVWRDTPTERDRAPGYAVSGLSIYTRAIASGPQAKFLSGHHQPRISGGPERTLEQKIEYERERLLHCEGQLRVEDDPKRREKLEQHIDIKAALIAKWTAELENGELQ